MKIATVLFGAIASLASAHDDPREAHSGMPKLLGARRFLSELKARNALPDAFNVPAGHLEEHQPTDGDVMEDLRDRQVSTTGQCGPGFGICPSTQCCSPAG